MAFFLIYEGEINEVLLAEAKPLYKTLKQIHWRAVSLMFSWDPWCIFVYFGSSCIIIIINFKNLIIAMACTMNINDILDNDLLFFILA